MIRVLRDGETITIGEQKYSYKCPNHTRNLNNSRLQDKWCDVTIKVNGKELRAHKVILGSNLKYFEAMFSSDSFQESKGGVITMEAINEATDRDLEALIAYAYTGEIYLTEDNALSLLMTANYLGEEGIEEACVKFLKNYLRKSDAFRAYQFANAIDSVALKNAASATIAKNFIECSTTNEYLDLDYQSLIRILFYAKAEPVSSQKMFFGGIMRWITHVVEDRRSYMNQLLSCIDIAEMTADDLIGFLYGNVVDQIDEHGIVKDVMLCYQCSKLNKTEMKKQKVLMIIGYEAPYKVNPTLCFQIYNFAEEKWFPPEKNLSENGLRYFRHLFFNDKFYYFEVSDPVLHHLEVFDPATKRSTLLNSSDFIHDFADSAMCADGKFLYFCGGININPPSGRSTKVLKYDPQTNLYEELPPLMDKRAFAEAIFYEGFLHVLGGSDYSRDLDSVCIGHYTSTFYAVDIYQTILVEKYDPETNEWVSMPSMTVPRSSFKVAILDGKLYACGGLGGGCGDKGTIEVYDPMTESWRQVTNMSKGGRLSDVIAHDGKLLVLYHGSGMESVDMYDPREDQWHTDLEMFSGLKIIIKGGSLISASCIANRS